MSIGVRLRAEAAGKVALSATVSILLCCGSSCDRHEGEPAVHGWATYSEKNSPLADESRLFREGGRRLR